MSYFYHENYEHLGLFARMGSEWVWFFDAETDEELGACQRKNKADWLNGYEAAILRQRNNSEALKKLNQLSYFADMDLIILARDNRNDHCGDRACRECVP